MTEIAEFFSRDWPAVVAAAMFATAVTSSYLRAAHELRRLNDRIDAVLEDVSDHETRIRAVERRR